MSLGSTIFAPVRHLYELTSARLHRQPRVLAQRACLATVASLAGPVLVTDRSGRLQWASDEARALLARTGCDESPRDLASIMHPADWDALRGDLGRGAACLQGRWRWGREGSWRIIQGRVVDATDNPAFGGVVLAIADVSDLEEAAGLYRQAMKLDAVGMMASGIAHDFNNLLASIRLNAELLEMTADEPVSELAEIQRTVDRGAALCRRLLTIARADQREPRALDLAEVIRGSLPMLRSAVPAGVELVFEGTPVGVVADRVQLEMVLLNLAVNASDAMMGSGRLTLSCWGASVADGDALSLEGIRVGEWSVLSVADTGPGISPDVIDRIFEPFFTTKPAGKGTGLGLSTVFGIATALRGYVRARSVLGTGATFSVYLPTRRADAADPADPADAAVVDAASAPKPAVRSGVVLVAEDDFALRFAMARLFARSGWQVIEARDGAQAQQLLEERAWDIDLLVTDIEMPHVDGVELIAALSVRRPRVPVIAISGRLEEDGLSLPWSKHRRFLHKPFSLGDLLTAAADVTANRPGDEPPRAAAGD